MATTSATTPRKYTTSTLMAAGLQKLGKKFWAALTRKELEGLRPQIKPVQPKRRHVGAHSSLCIVCTTTTTPTITQEIAQYSLNPRERWGKTPACLHNNLHPEK
jgi:hypothetical protein